MTNREQMKTICVCVMKPKILGESKCLSERRESVIIFASNRWVGTKGAQEETR